MDGLVIEAWFFGDELRLLRQLGVIPDAQLRAAASLARPDRLGSGASPVMVDLWEHPVAPKDPASGKCRLIPLAVGLRCGPWDFSTEHHELGKELLAGFATAELDKHLEKGYYDHLDREQLQYQAQQQANYLYDQQYGQY